MKIKDYVNNICVNAKLSSQEISCLAEGEKNLILLSLVEEINLSNCPVCQALLTRVLICGSDAS